MRISESCCDRTLAELDADKNTTRRIIGRKGYSLYLNQRFYSYISKIVELFIYRKTSNYLKNH